MPKKTVVKRRQKFVAGESLKAKAFRILSSKAFIVVVVVVVCVGVAATSLIRSDAYVGENKLKNSTMANNLQYWVRRGQVAYGYTSGNAHAQIYSSTTQGSSLYQEVTLPAGCYYANARALGSKINTTSTLAVRDMTNGGRLLTTRKLSLSTTAYKFFGNTADVYSNGSTRLRIEVYADMAGAAVSVDDITLVHAGCSATSRGASFLRVAQGQVGKAGSYTNGGFWCSKFTSWVAQQAGIASGFPVTDSPAIQHSHYKSRGALRTSRPAPGMIVFIDLRGLNNSDQYISHVGIIESISADGSINTIEGNSRSNGVVNRETRRIGDGYVIAFANP